MGTGQGVEIRGNFKQQVTCLRMSASTGNRKSKTVKQACLICWRIRKETQVARAEWVTEEMTRNVVREGAGGLQSRDSGKLWCGLWLVLRMKWWLLQGLARDKETLLVSSYFHRSISI